MPTTQAKPRKWSAHVNATSDALDLKEHLFQSDNPAEIAKSLKRSAERSKAPTARPFNRPCRC